MNLKDTNQLTHPLRHIPPSNSVAIIDRYSTAEDYRYGFNGKESDDEVSVGDGSYDFGARMYDVRLGRWWSVDGKFKENSFESPYTFTSNIPTIFVDPDGMKKRHFIVINNHITGKSITIELPSSDELRREMIEVRQYFFGLRTNSTHYEYAWFDFTQTITFDVYKEHVEMKSEEKRNGTARTTTFLDNEWWANVKIGEQDKIWGGISWTTSGFVGAGNSRDKQGRVDTRYENIDDLLSMFDLAYGNRSDGMGFAIPKDLQSEYMLLELMDTMVETVDRQADAINIGINLITTIKDNLPNKSIQFEKCMDCGDVFDSNDKLIKPNEVKAMGLDTAKMKKISAHEH